MANLSQFQSISLWRQLGPALVCMFLTTLLYTLAFAPFSYYQSAFICFTPFIAWVFFRPSFKVYAVVSLLTSILCWVATLHWLHNLGIHLNSSFMTWGSVLGCALIFAPFHWLWYLLLYRLQPCLVTKKWYVRIVGCCALAGGWVILEWARESFLQVQWNTLSSVLWKEIALIQVAAYTGAWGISFYIVLFNVGIALYIRHLFTRSHLKRSLRQKFCPEFYLVFGVLGLFFLLFFQSIDQFRSQPQIPLLRAAAIQPNIPQSVKMNPKQVNRILREFDKGMHELMAGNPQIKPDVFLWPESATPLEAIGNTRFANYTRTGIQNIIDQYGVPLLMGNMKTHENRISLTLDPSNPKQLSTSPLENLPGKFSFWNAPPMVYEDIESEYGQIEVKRKVRRDGTLQIKMIQNGHFQPGDKVELAYNIVNNGIYLQLPQEGLSLHEYSKQKLVPFGEYVPFGRLFPFVKKMVHVADEFQPGLETTPIPLNASGRSINVGPIVCYEDVFSDISREHAQAGAHCLFVATNDGWYGKTGAAFQHAAHSALRAVETRRPVIRCGNNGWTGWFDEMGDVRQHLTHPDDGIYIQGQLLMDIEVSPAFQDSQCFYVQYGDWFVMVCAVFLIGAFVLLRKKTDILAT